MQNIMNYHCHRWPLFALVCIWWVASAWNVIAAKQVILLDPSAVPLMALVSNIPGAVVYIGLWFHDRTVIHHSTRQMVPLALMHTFGLYASYMGLVGANVSLVQAVKAMEPLLAMALSICILGQAFSVRAALAAGLVVVGVGLVCITDTNYTWTALCWVLTSSVSTQIRNQLMKRLQSQRLSIPDPPPSPTRTGILMFVSVSAYSVFVSLVIILAFAPVYQFSLVPSMSLVSETPHRRNLAKVLLIAGSMHFAYNMASFGVLSLTTPTSHSLANTTKRAFVVGSSAIFLKEIWTWATITGMCFVTIGSTYYAKLQMSEDRNSPLNDRVKTRRIYVSLPLFLVILCAIKNFQNFSDGVFSLAFHYSYGCRGTCIYDYVSLCTNRITEEDIRFAVLDECVDICVRTWAGGKCNLTPKSVAAQHGPNLYLSDMLGRGRLKDRVDWSLFRQGLTHVVLANKQSECYYHANQSTLSITNQRARLRPEWWDTPDALPIVSRRYNSGGSYLPPWYGASDTSQDLPLGYALPEGPIKGIKSATHASSEFRPKVSTGVPNLVDCYNYHLLSMLSGRTVFNSSVGPTVCAVGSILGHDCDIVWGAGFITEGGSIPHSKGNDSEIFAVRGPDSLERLPRDHIARNHTVYGDPGLLASLIYPMPSLEEVVDVCIVPHYIDHHLPIIENLLNKTHENGITIRLLNIEGCSLDEYLEDMNGCKTILSSSLHGLVFGMAYGIPAMRVMLSSKVYRGHFTFRDFYNGIGHPELYVYEDLRNASEIPISRLFKLLTSPNLTAPALNMEELWNAYPLHAETLGTSRKDHLAFSASFIHKLPDLILHRSYTKLSDHIP